MRDRSRDLRNSSANIIPLGEYLADAHPAFRHAVICALAEEGFDLEETLPNLQLASHILETIQWLGERGHGPQWHRFEEALRSADRKGVLVNLGASGRLAFQE